MTSKVEYYFYPNGTFDKVWRNEKERYHREDGPAYEYSDGRRCWYKDGQWHREDGPALVWYEGSRRYFLNGKEYTKEEYWKEVERLKKGRE